ncbi:MAG: CoA transferase [Dehalococcoidia bacterium]|nr:CoA transferase [Dehalococcoidia bacterium]
MTSDKPAAPLPLEGVRVCDFTWIIAGPQATRIFADLGAEVIKVENESYLDAVRGSAGLHNNFHRNKQGITANIHHPKGREVVERLIAKSDIVIENYSSGAFARMGFPYQRLKELREDIIYVSLSGFGHEGRDADYATWGPTAQGVSGMTAVSGLEDQPPAGWGYSYLDHTAGFYAAIGAMMALWHRRQTGEGQHLDMAQVETGMVLAGVPMLDFQVNGRHYERIGNGSRWPAVAPHGIYPTADEDRWIAIATETDEHWAVLCEVLERPELATEPRFASNEVRFQAREALDAALGRLTARFDADSLAAALSERGVPAGACQTIEDRMEHDPQLAARGFYPTAEHPELGMHRFEGLPMHFSRARWRIDRGAPVLGEDTRTVLRDLLGYDEREIAEMTAEAAI